MHFTTYLIKASQLHQIPTSAGLQGLRGAHGSQGRFAGHDWGSGGIARAIRLSPSRAGGTARPEGRIAGRFCHELGDVGGSSVRSDLLIQTWIKYDQVLWD